ncbi:hypothetical protein PILCRDRAFT_713454 [Piloderma croceum F 1598]|uniref:Uncharacterized protein n=1 Tax=Piloderma croceum (strain F 1598) TaxID=765440 RepID=A0A0C3AJX7_PILCF|nr:hypothetical protein PILCRDRAFT_713454 [Piloderma croceum F 1598]
MSLKGPHKLEEDYARLLVLRSPWLVCVPDRSVQPINVAATYSVPSKLYPFGRSRKHN